ncbi:MAG TPA: hypothetical protein ENJ34_03360 [Epsilonproteobacteria bacterium]|nr:hypothetical protein [Campylobacterota bacterium]
MSIQFKTIFFFFAIGMASVQAESNVYGFGSDEPQKVTSTTSSLNTMSAMRQKIREQDERIDGLTTIIEGLSASLHELQMKKGTRPAVSTSQNDDALLQKLAKMIDEINANYVRKSELDKALGKKTKSTTPSKNKSTESTSNKSNATLYSEGVRHFVKQRYDEAKKRFTLTDSKSYKPAASNYYLGEISYYTKQYEDAIFYFKKSAGLYDKASYMDVLLLHTAISLDKTGNKSQAKVFYENIIENYKGKKTAKIASDRLKKL